MRNILKALVVTVVLVVAGSCFIDTAWADKDVATAMFVSPMTQKILLTPGERYEGTILVSNSNSARSDLYYALSVGSYGVVRKADSKDDYGDVDIATQSSANIMMDWISFADDSGVIEPNGSEEIPFYIDVPLDAPAGAQYATILVTDVTPASVQEGNVNISNNLQIASAIFANVAGETIKKGSISENYIPAFITSGKLEATSMVRNDGNIYTDAEYILQVWPLLSDEEICTNEENPEKSLVFPDTEKYHAQSCDLPMVGVFKVKQVVKIFGEESVVEKTVIKCPIWLLFIIVFAVMALIIWLVMRAKARRRVVE